MATRSEARLGYVPHFEVTTVDGSVCGTTTSGNDGISCSSSSTRRRVKRADFTRHSWRLVERSSREKTPRSWLQPTRYPSWRRPRLWLQIDGEEILHLETGSSGESSRFPDINELLSWVHFAEIQCPECPP